MLDDLDSVDWAALSHAYGPAGDVPGNLRALLSEDGETRARALQDLCNTIIHQGSVYAATAAAVPFLLEMAGDPKTVERKSVVAMLQEIARATTWGLYDSFYSERERSSAAHKARVAVGLAHRRAIRAALWQGWDWLASYGDGRLECLNILATLLRFGEMAPEFEDVVAAKIRQWATELEGGSERVHFAMALGMAAQSRGDALAILVRRFKVEGNSDVRLAIAVFLFDHGRLDEADCDIFFGAIRVGRLPEGFAEWDISLGERICRLGPTVLRRNFSEIVEIVRNADGLFVQKNITPMLSLFFSPRAERPTARRRAEQITDEQAEILYAIAENNEYWTSFHNARLPLPEFGLPVNRCSLRELAARGGKPRGPRNDPDLAAENFLYLVKGQIRELGEPFSPRPKPTNSGRTLREAVAHLRDAGVSSSDLARVKKLFPVGEGDDALAAFLPLCPNLERLDLSDGEVSDGGAAYLAAITKIRELSLVRCPITDAGLAHIQGMREMAKLGLSGCPIRGEGLRHVARFAHLESLGLSETQLDDASLAHLAGLGRLNRLGLDATPITGEGFVHLTGLKELATLSLRNCPNLTGVVLEHVGRLSKLRELRCEGCPKIASGLGHLGLLQSLTTLELGGTAIDDRAIAGLPRLAALMELKLESTGVTEAGLAELARHPALKRLKLSKTKPGAAVFDALARLPALEKVGLDYAAVGDAALSGLGRFARLRALDLSGTQISDGAVKRLRELPAIRWLGLRETAVSDGAIAELRAAFPEATIVI